MIDRRVLNAAPSSAMLLGIGLLLGACATMRPEPPAARLVFETHCASCHGIGGEGDGPVAETLAVPVPNLTTLSARNGGVFPRDTVARYIDGREMPDAHGARQMPVWGLVFATTEQIVPGAQSPEVRIDTLLDYLEAQQTR